tara:strand:+ start:44307 stop:44546 length:240 start_codon:yes stop_codon:yes gene_type:complete
MFTGNRFVHREPLSGGWNHAFLVVDSRNFIVESFHRLFELTELLLHLCSEERTVEQAGLILMNDGHHLTSNSWLNALKP